VEEYSLREDWLGAAQIYNPLPARGDCFLQFYLADRYRVVTVESGEVHSAPRCVLVGPHVRRREDLIWTGHLKMFTVRFTAVGFRALFGVSASAIRDVAESAELVLGPSVRGLEERLAAADEDELPVVAERFLLERLMLSRVALDGGTGLRMVETLGARGGAVSVERLAERFGLSVRQMERMFQEQVGVSPKVYARLVRLRRAMEMSGREARPDWAGIAARAGYFDQSHMVREFQALNGATPVAFTELGRRAREYRQTEGGAGDVAFVLSGVEAGLVA
jgi:AraC-like DNA-binding protein